MTTENVTVPKVSLTKCAVWSILLNAAIILINVYYLLNNTVLKMTPDNYATLFPIRTAIGLFSMILLIVVYSIRKALTSYADQEDELAKLHRYKAGYIASYIFLFAIIFLIYTVKNFEAAFTGDFLDNANLAFILISFLQILEHLVFIYLEKHSLE